MSSLKRIIEYSSSSDEDDSRYGGHLPKYQRLSDEMQHQSISDVCDRNLEISGKNEQKTKLKIPDTVVNMFSNKEKHKDNPEIHGGRKRTFAHVRGSWASFIHVPYSLENIDFMKEQISKSLACLDIKWSPCDDLHVTLSRTVSIPHHCIEPLYSELKRELSTEQCFIATLQPNVRVYVNDENSRTFLALMVDDDSRCKLLNIVHKINAVFKAFRLPPYYDNPSVHISFGWVNGDVTCSNKLPADILLATYHFSNIQKISSHIFELNIDKVQLKSGNKVMAVALQ